MNLAADVDRHGRDEAGAALDIVELQRNPVNKLGEE